LLGPSRELSTKDNNEIFRSHRCPQCVASYWDVWDTLPARASVSLVLPGCSVLRTPSRSSNQLKLPIEEIENNLISTYTRLRISSNIERDLIPKNIRQFVRQADH
jgi:hypothetical protein